MQFSEEDDKRRRPLICQTGTRRGTSTYRRKTAHLRMGSAGTKWRDNPELISVIIHLPPSPDAARYGHKKKAHHHASNIITLKPYRHWCSNGFVIQCRNRHVARVVFSLNCCVHNAISGSAITGGVIVQ